MLKIELLNFLKEKGVINNSNKRKNCWRKYFDEKCKIEFEKYSKNYRTEDEAWFCLTHNVEPKHCEVCGNLAKFTGSVKYGSNGYLTVCENCSANNSPIKLKKFNESISKRTKEDKIHSFEKRKKTNKEKYGDENYTLFGKQYWNSLSEESKQKKKESYEKTMLKRYGVNHNFKLPSNIKISGWVKHRNSILEKIRKNSIIKYGYESPNQNPEIKKKQLEGLINHYGSIENALKHKNELSRKTKLEKYGTESYNNCEKTKQTLENKHTTFEHKNNCTRYTKLIKEYGQGWLSLKIPYIYNGRFRYVSNNYINDIIEYSKEEHNLQATSLQENELYEFISNNTSYKIFRNVKNVIKNNKENYCELDIYIPDLKIAFEYNGIYWHSIPRKPKLYHYFKSKKCYDNNIQLIHIWEHEWINNNQEIKEKILELLSGKDCSKYNWISINDYNNYILEKPKEKIINTKYSKYKIYDEGQFIKKNI